MRLAYHAAVPHFGHRAAAEGAPAPPRKRFPAQPAVPHFGHTVAADAPPPPTSPPAPRTHARLSWRSGNSAAIAGGGRGRYCAALAPEPRCRSCCTAWSPAGGGRGRYRARPENGSYGFPVRFPGNGRRGNRAENRQ